MLVLGKYYKLADTNSDNVDMSCVRGDVQVELKPMVGVIMGSKSDWETMKITAQTLEDFEIPYEKLIVSAHRTPDRLYQYAETAEGKGIRVIIAGAGGAAHLPGMVAAKTVVPVLGVPIQTSGLNGLDSLLSIVQMPGGIPVGTVAIGNAGAKNAGLLTIAMLAINDDTLKEKLKQFRIRQAEEALLEPWEK